jgi:GH24 family phage-related lysozyme (muramidase)
LTAAAASEKAARFYSAVRGVLGIGAGSTVDTGVGASLTAPRQAQSAAQKKKTVIRPMTRRIAHPLGLSVRLASASASAFVVAELGRGQAEAEAKAEAEES